MRCAHFFSVLFVAGALAGCSSTLKPAAVNTEGRFDTSSTVDASGQTIAGPFIPERHGKMAVVFTFTENNTVNDFFYQSIKNSKKFENVYNQSELEKYIIKHNIEGVTDTGSLLSMNKLAKIIGPFLVIKPYIEWKGGYDYIATLEVIDAETTETVLKVEKKAFNWAGLDKPLFYPLFNALIDWTEGRAPPPAPEPRTTGVKKKR
jgi:hypothetical protein